MKIEPIRAADRKICDRALMERWLYGKVTASGELYISHAVSVLFTVRFAESTDPHSELRASLETIAEETNVPVSGCKLQQLPLLQNVIVLELKPFSRANKKVHEDRKSIVWNKLWGLVRPHRTIYRVC